MANSYIKNLKKILPIIQLPQHSNYFDFLKPFISVNTMLSQLWSLCIHSILWLAFFIQHFIINISLALMLFWRVHSCLWNSFCSMQMWVSHKPRLDSRSQTAFNLMVRVVRGLTYSAPSKVSSEDAVFVCHCSLQIKGSFCVKRYKLTIYKTDTGWYGSCGGGGGGNEVKV